MPASWERKKIRGVRLPGLSCDYDELSLEDQVALTDVAVDLLGVSAYCAAGERGNDR